jgi:hypothetical protein
LLGNDAPLLKQQGAKYFNVLDAGDIGLIHRHKA